MKTNEYLTTLLLEAAGDAHGDLALKLQRAWDDLGPGHAAVAEKIHKGGRKQLLTAITEAGRIAREQHASACRVVYHVTALLKHLNAYEDRIISPWEALLMDSTAPLPEFLRAQNDILVDPLKKKKGEEEDGERCLPSGALSKLYTEALAFDSIEKLCAELGLSLEKEDDVLALDAALLGLIKAYALAQARSEEIAKRAKRHADELESQRYTLIANSRPIHEKAEEIRLGRKNPTLPGIDEKPPRKGKKEKLVATHEDAAPAEQSAQPAGGERDAPEDPPPGPTGLTADGKIPWRALRVWREGREDQVMGVQRLLILDCLKHNNYGELDGYLFVPPDNMVLGQVVLKDGREALPQNAALFEGEVIELRPDLVDWSGYEPPEIKSERVQVDGDHELRRIPSHRQLSHYEVSEIDGSFPEPNITSVSFDEARLVTEYIVPFPDHQAHMETKGLATYEEPEDKASKQSGPVKREAAGAPQKRKGKRR